MDNGVSKKELKKLKSYAPDSKTFFIQTKNVSKYFATKS